jgi:hypothetical protein
MTRRFETYLEKIHSLQSCKLLVEKLKNATFQTRKSNHIKKATLKRIICQKCYRAVKRLCIWQKKPRKNHDKLSHIIIIFLFFRFRIFLLWFGRPSLNHSNYYEEKGIFLSNCISKLCLFIMLMCSRIVAYEKCLFVKREIYINTYTSQLKISISITCGRLSKSIYKLTKLALYCILHHDHMEENKSLFYTYFRGQRGGARK